MPPPTSKVIPNGEELYRTLLGNVKEIYDVEGMIAGGALRDLKVGVPSKDIDLFLPLTLKEFEEAKDELGWTMYGSMRSPYKEVSPTARYSAAALGHALDIVLLGRDYVGDPMMKSGADNIATAI